MPEKAKTTKTTKKPVAKKPAVHAPAKPHKAPVVHAPVAKPAPVMEPQTNDEFVMPEGAEKSKKYWEAIGRRKTAIARVRLYTQGDKEFLVNGKKLNIYLADKDLQQIADSAIQKMKCADKFRIMTVVSGGGLHAQAEAIRHGISRALTLFNADFRKRLKKAGYLKRDPRMRERKKFGLKRARRAPQWTKR